MGIKLRTLLLNYDFPMGTIKVNNDNLSQIWKGRICDLLDSNLGLLDENIEAFGCYDNELCVRVNI